jgi:hypothetical protein
MRTNVDLTNLSKKYNIPLYSVISKDYLKFVPKQNKSGIIINLSDLKDSNGRYLEGTHWISLYLENSTAFYYDSFGFPSPTEVLDYVKGYKLYDSKKEIQNIHSGICGDLSLFMIMYMSNSKMRLKYRNPVDRFQSFLNLFSDNPLKNETILKSLVPWKI